MYFFYSRINHFN